VSASVPDIQETPESVCAHTCYTADHAMQSSCGTRQETAWDLKWELENKSLKGDLAWLWCRNHRMGTGTRVSMSTLDTNPGSMTQLPHVCASLEPYEIVSIRLF
jgi:hypothetical protein